MTSSPAHLLTSAQVDDFLHHHRQQLDLLTQHSVWAASVIAQQRIQLDYLVHQAASSASLMERLFDQVAAQLQPPTPDDSDGADDDPGSALELYELRRWKQHFSIEPTRSMMDKIEELNGEVHRLQRLLRERLRYERLRKKRKSG
jgi:hypothetical protein